MGILSTLEQRQQWAASDDRWYGVMTQPASGMQVSADSSLGVTAIWAAVSVIAGTVATLPIKLYRRQGDTAKELAREDRRFALLHSRPNRWQTPADFKEMMQGHLLLRGNAFAQIVVSRGRQPVELVPLHPDRIRIETSPDGELVYFYRRRDGTDRPFPAAEMLHLRGLSSDGVIGYTPITVMAEAVGLAMAAERYGARFFANDGTPGGVLSHPGALGKEAFDRLKADWARAHAGVDKAHAVAILEEGMTWTQIGVAAEDAQLLQMRQFQVAEVARMFNIPPHLLKDLSRATFSNIEEQSLEFVIHCIRPWAVRWEEHLNRALLGQNEQGDLFYKVSMDALLRGSSAARSQFYREQFAIGALSINEIRELEDRNPVEGGDARFIPLNMLPLEALTGDAIPTGKAEPLPPENDTDEDEEDDEATRFLPPGLTRADRPIKTEVRRAAVVALRQRYQQSYRRVFADVGERVVRQEVKALRRIVSRTLNGARARTDLEVEFEDFYAGFRSTIADRFKPALAGFAALLAPAAADEVGGDVDAATERLERFVGEYAEAASKRHVGSSSGQLRSIIRKFELEPDDAVLEVELTDRLDEWLEHRPEKIGLREAIQGGAAMTVAAFAALGVTRLIWVAAGEGCPLCAMMDGRVVEMSGEFLGKGAELNPDGPSSPLVMKSGIQHPPLHGGCECMIAAG